MTKSDDKLLFQLLRTMRSGRVKIRFNSDEALEVSVSGDDISIDLEERTDWGKFTASFRERITELRLLRSLSKLLHGSSIKVEIYRNRKKIVSMGRGVNSALGSEKVHFLNLIRSRKS